MRVRVRAGKKSSLETHSLSIAPLDWSMTQKRRISQPYTNFSLFINDKKNLTVVLIKQERNHMMLLNREGPA